MQETLHSSVGNVMMSPKQNILMYLLSFVISLAGCKRHRPFPKVFNIVCDSNVDVKPLFSMTYSIQEWYDLVDRIVCSIWNGR